MFTGIVRGVGRIVDVERPSDEGGVRLTINARDVPGFDRAELQVISQSVERAALVEHPFDDVRLGAGEHITHVLVMLDDASQVPLGRVAAEPADLLKFVEDDA